MPEPLSANSSSNSNPDNSHSSPTNNPSNNSPDNSNTSPTNNPLNNSPDNPNNSSPIQEDNPIVFLFKWLAASTESSVRFKRTFSYLAIVLLFIGVCWSIGIAVVQPKKINIFDKISVEAGEAGTLTVENDGKKSIILMLSSNGGTDNEWIDPEIRVKKGDRIKINGSGKINLSLPGLVAAAKDDVEPEILWNDPEGLPPKYDLDPLYPGAGKYKTIPEQPFGMLIAAIKEQDGERKFSLYPVGKNGNFEAKTDGKLLLTVNDVWLSPEKQDAYLPPEPTGKDFAFYKERVLRSIDKDRTKAEQKTLTWSKEKWNQELLKQYEERKKKWEVISNQRNYGLWYDDNVGSFSVTISIEQKGKSL